MLVTLLLRERGRRRGPEPRADHDPDHGAENRDDHGLRADHLPDLTAFHPHRPQQADLARALEHRQHERVDDADHARQNRQRKQHVDQSELLVDACLLGLLELRTALHPDVRVRLEVAVDGPSRHHARRIAC